MKPEEHEPGNDLGVRGLQGREEADRNEFGAEDVLFVAESLVQKIYEATDALGGNGSPRVQELSELVLHVEYLKEDSLALIQRDDGGIHPEELSRLIEDLMLLIQNYAECMDQLGQAPYARTLTEWADRLCEQDEIDAEAFLERERQAFHARAVLSALLEGGVIYGMDVQEVTEVLDELEFLNGKQLALSSVKEKTEEEIFDPHDAARVLEVFSHCVDRYTAGDVGCFLDEWDGQELLSLRECGHLTDAVVNQQWNDEVYAILPVFYEMVIGFVEARRDLVWDRLIACRRKFQTGDA